MHQTAAGLLIFLFSVVFPYFFPIGVIAALLMVAAWRRKRANWERWRKGIGVAAVAIDQ